MNLTGFDSFRCEVLFERIKLITISLPLQIWNLRHSKQYYSTKSLVQFHTESICHCAQTRLYICYFKGVGELGAWGSYPGTASRLNLFLIKIGGWGASGLKSPLEALPICMLGPNFSNFWK